MATMHELRPARYYEAWASPDAKYTRPESPAPAESRNDMRVGLTDRSGEKLAQAVENGIGLFGHQRMAAAADDFQAGA
jgi:hypothetical protein